MALRQVGEVINDRGRLLLLERGICLLQGFARGLQIPTRRLLRQRLLREALDLGACLLELFTAPRGCDTGGQNDREGCNEGKSFHG